MKSLFLHISFSVTRDPDLQIEVRVLVLVSKIISFSERRFTGQRKGVSGAIGNGISLKEKSRTCTRSSI